MASPTTMNFIASPEIVVRDGAGGTVVVQSADGHATGADGKPFRLEPPKPAPEVPPEASTAARRLHRRRPGRQRHELAVDPNSQRLQLIEPWPAWDGNDFPDCRCWSRQGKTTTDHISPAGPWLRLRGHLDKFSDNMLMGAINAFTATADRLNLLTGGRGDSLSAIARDYNARGLVGRDR